MKEKGESNAGRKTLYKESYANEAYKLCLLGATDKDLADFFDVCEATINNWKLEFPEFVESIRRGKKVADMQIAESLFNSAQDRTIKETQAIKVKNIYYNEKGKRIEEEKIEIVAIEKGVPANDRSIQFWLRNRSPKNWKSDRDNEDEDGNSNLKKINVTLKISDNSESE